MSDRPVSLFVFPLKLLVTSRETTLYRVQDNRVSLLCTLRLRSLEGESGGWLCRKYGFWVWGLDTDRSW